MMILRVVGTLIFKQTITPMRALFILLFCLAVSSCSQYIADFDETSTPIVTHKEQSNATLADIAYDLLEFDKYKEALELVRDDKSMTATTVKIIANDRLGNPRAAIDYAILDLRLKDSTRFYEGSWELCELYEIFKKDIDYGMKLINDEYVRCSRNYQIRQLMMKLYWYLDDYEKVVSLGDEFRKEFPDMSDDVTFNAWRNDALDSLSIRAPETYKKIIASYQSKRWNGVETN